MQQLSVVVEPFKLELSPAKRGKGEFFFSLIFNLIPERFTLVKMEGYAVVMGPKLFIVSPGVPAGF